MDIDGVEYDGGDRGLRYVSIAPTLGNPNATSDG